jgi:hypothetical protein
MTPATITVRATPARRARDGRSHPRRVQQRTDADVYAGIAHAWWAMHQPGEHHEHPIRTYLTRPGFAEEVWGRDDVDPHEVLTVCARIVSFADIHVRDRATQTTTGAGLTQALDPLRGWWYPLTSTPELGIHFWQLVIVPVELRCIAPIDDPPPLQLGRLPKRALRKCL